MVFSNVSLAKDSIKLITNTPIDKSGPSQSCTVEICTSLLELINQAEKTIDFAIYGLRGQKEILNALINAEKKGVIVRGIIDKTLKGIVITAIHICFQKISKMFMMIIAQI